MRRRGTRSLIAGGKGRDGAMTVRPTVTVSAAVRTQIESIRVAYPRWQGIVEEIGRCQEWASVAAEPPCLLVVGPTGAGKSTLVASYAREHPAVLTESGVTHPVVTATIPSPATIKSLAALHHGISYFQGDVASRIM